MLYFNEYHDAFVLNNKKKAIVVSKKPEVEQTDPETEPAIQG